MPTNILMPALSPTMEKGKLARWLKKEGDKIKSGDIIAEIETDKATMEYEAVDEGTLAKIVVPEGTQDVAVNAVIAVLAAEGEDVKAAAGAKSAPAPKPAASSFETPPARAPQDEAKKASQPVPKPAPRPEVARSAVSKDAGPIVSASNRIFSSPLARRLAKEANIDLNRVQGSGPHGRVIARDIDAAKSGKGLRAPGAAPAAAMPMAASPSDAQVRALYEDGSYNFVPHDSMRKIIAQPLALQRVPDANVTWTETGMLHHRHSDVGVAVAIPGGLITPVVRHAEAKSLSTISNEMKDYAARARTRHLKPHEYQGGSTAISNLGMYGIKDFAAVINPPHATILAVGAADERAVVRNGAPT